MKLQVVTIDGTVIEADKFQAKKKGLELQKKSSGSSETIGFVPFERLMYAIPEDITHNVDQLDEISQ